MADERDIQAAIRLALGRRPDVTLWRNNCGGFQDKTGRVVKYGLQNPGGSDLIGLKRVKITPEMVGSEIAVFVAIEVKEPGRSVKPGDHQDRFLKFISAAGGISGCADSVDRAFKVLGK